MTAAPAATQRFVPSPQLLGILGAQLAVLVASLTVWHLASGRLIARVWISDPASVARRIWSWLETGFIYPYLEATLKSAGIGLALGAGTGIVLALAISQVPLAARVVDPFILGLYSIPQVAVMPLYILWFGIDIKPKVAIVASLVFFPLYFQTLAGTRAADRELIAVVRVMGANRLQTMRYVILPSFVAYIGAGIAIAVPLALIGALLGDMLVGSTGLGYLVVESTNRYDMTGALAAAVLLTILGLVSTVIARYGLTLLSGRRTQRGADGGLLRQVA